MAEKSPPPSRVAPTDAPAEAVERVVRRRLVPPVRGDVMVTRESAGRLATTAIWRYRLSVDGEERVNHRTFARYDAAAAQGEELAAKRHVRLFYVEDSVATLLMDYRRA